MKSKWQLFSSIFQLAVGVGAIVSFAILAFSGENMTRWIVTLVLSIAFTVLGVIGIIDYISAGRSEKKCGKNKTKRK